MTKAQHQAWSLALVRAARSGLPDTVIREHLTALTQAERKLTRIAERQCNGYPDAQGNWDERAADRDDVLWDRWSQRAISAARALGWQAAVQGDPRGYILTLHLPDGSSMAPEWA